MALYETIDYLVELSKYEINHAGTLTFDVAAANINGWDYTASVSGSEQYAILHSLYSFHAEAGATYDMFSLSYYEPFIMIIYDYLGNPITFNDDAKDPADVVLSDGISYSRAAIWDWVAPYTGTYYIDASWYQGEVFKTYALVLEEDVNTIPYGSKTVIGNGLNETFITGHGNDFIDGMGGTDTVIFLGHQANYTIYIAEKGFTVKDNTGVDGTDTVINIERLQFSDHALTISFSPTKILLESYRIYKAAFDRAPDYGGLGYWYYVMGHGASLTDISGGFIGSNEFKAMYGVNPSDSTFVNLLYHHVLGRDLDQGVGGNLISAHFGN